MKIIYIENMFDKKDREEFNLDFQGWTCLELFEHFAIGKDHKEFICIVNGGVADWAAIPAQDDEVIFTPDIKDSKIISMVMGAVLVVVGIVTSWTGIGGYLGAAGIAMMAGGAVGMMFSPKTPNTSSFENSATYSWEGIKNTIGEGNSVPIVYGRHRVGGGFIEAFVDGPTTKGIQEGKYLNALIALGEGQIESVDVNTIQINDKELKHYDSSTKSHNLSVDIQQTLLLNQPFTYSSQTICKKMTISFDAPEGAGALRVGIEKKLSTSSLWTACPDCKYTYVADDPILRGWVNWRARFGTTLEFDPEGRYDVRVTLLGGDSSIKLTTIEEDGGFEALSYDYRLGYDNQQPISNFSRISRHYNVSGVTLKHNRPYVYKTQDEIDSALLTLKFPALFSMNSKGSLKEKAVQFRIETALQSGGAYTVFDIVEVKNASSGLVEYDYRINFSARAKYLIRITRLTEDDDNNPKISSASSFTGVVEAENCAVAYQNTALLGVRLLATNALSGALPSITAIVNGKIIKDVRTNVAGFSTNPANIVYDLLTNARYGLGRYITDDNIHIESFRTFADWCDEEVPYDHYDGATGDTTRMMEKRYEMNLVIDKEFSAADLITKILMTCRATPYWEGHKLKLVIDRPGVDVQLFGMGAIVPDSYEETYINSSNIPNQVTATFLDETQDYKKENITAADVARLNEPLNNDTIQLYGLTKPSRVRRELIYAMKRAKGIKKGIKFKTGMSAIICEPGDRFLFSHDTPQYGYSGRLKLVGATLTLDRTVPLVAGRQYKLRVKRADNSFYTTTWTAGSTNPEAIITVASGVQCAALDQYAVGEINKEAKPYRLLSLTRNDDKTVNIVGEEVNDSVHADDGTIKVDEVKYSQLGLVARYTLDGTKESPVPVLTRLNQQENSSAYDVPSIVGGIKLTEKCVKLGPIITSDIFVGFDPATVADNSVGFIEKYEVLISSSTDTDNSWQTAGYTTRRSFTIHNVEKGVKYYVAVRPWTNFGITNNILEIAEAYQYHITPTGVALFEASVENVKMVSAPGGFVLSWDAYTEEPISGYNVYLNGTLIAEQIKVTSYTYNIEMTEMKYTFTVMPVSMLMVEGVGTQVSFDASRPIVSGLRAEKGTWGFTFSWDAIREYFSIEKQAFIPVKGYNLYIDGKLIISEYQGTSYSYIREVADGAHTFEIRVVDLYGNVAETGSVIVFNGKLDRGVSSINHTLTRDWILSLTFNPIEGSNEPQVLFYQILASADPGVMLWGEAMIVVGQAENKVNAQNKIYWEGRLPSAEIVRIFVRAKLKIGETEEWSNTWLTLNLQTLERPKLRISIKEPDFVVSWGAVKDANFYEMITVRNGWAYRDWVAGTSQGSGIPRYDGKVKVRAWSDAGVFSPWMEEEIDVEGVYNFNELVNANIDFVNGRYLNFAWASDNKVVRPSILGLALSLPIGNMNDSDLFNFPTRYENTSMANLANIPVGWFRENWWLPEDGYFESAIYNFGAQYSGTIVCGLSTVITKYGKTAADIAPVSATALAPLTEDQILSDDALLTCELFVSSDNITWKAVRDGDSVANIQYLRVKGSVLYASPFDEIKVTATRVSIDVPDVSQTGEITITNGSATLTFPKAFRQCNFVLANCAGNFRAWVGYGTITKNGCTLYVDTTTSQKVFWLAKGY